MKRVLMQPGQPIAMSVSLPGVDVSSANIDQMAFDARWSGHQFYASGTLDSSNDSVATYLFGETLDRVPLMVGYVDSNVSAAPGATYLGFLAYRGNGTDLWLYAQVTTSAVQFRCKFGAQVGRLYFSLFRRIAG